MGGYCLKLGTRLTFLPVTQSRRYMIIQSKRKLQAKLQACDNDSIEEENTPVVHQEIPSEPEETPSEPEELINSEVQPCCYRRCYEGKGLSQETIDEMLDEEYSRVQGTSELKARKCYAPITTCSESVRSRPLSEKLFEFMGPKTVPQDAETRAGWRRMMACVVHYLADERNVHLNGYDETVGGILLLGQTARMRLGPETDEEKEFHLDAFDIERQQAVDSSRTFLSDLEEEMYNDDILRSLNRGLFLELHSWVQNRLPGFFEWLRISTPQTVMHSVSDFSNQMVRQMVEEKNARASGPKKSTADPLYQREFSSNISSHPVTFSDDIADPAIMLALSSNEDRGYLSMDRGNQQSL